MLRAAAFCAHAYVKFKSSCTVALFIFTTHVLWIRYDLSAEKLHYTTATLRYNTLPFLTRTIFLSTSATYVPP